MVLPQYDGLAIERLLSLTSGQADVYKATLHGEAVVAKVFRDATLSHGYRDELAGLLRFQHPNVLPLRMCYETPAPCIVTPYMSGGDLRSYLDAKGAQSEAEVLRISNGIAQGTFSQVRQFSSWPTA
jgi:serine/threonine protein kinase